MMRIDDDLLMALADGELDDVTRARAERAIADDPALQAQLDVQRRLRERLAAHYGPVAEESLPDRLVTMLDTNVVDFGAARTARAARPIWQQFAALAATLVLGLAVGLGLQGPGGTVGVEDGVIVAQGELAEALETQLASTQPPGAVTRIGVTFQRADGRPCRTFDSGITAGLACRDGAGWQLIMTASGAAGSRSDYRQAGSDNPLVLQAAQELMAGEPLDEAAERRARDSGWQRSAAAR
jgi:hypothetical protein